jgi:sRNA-binding regulator protein Hfq
MANSVDGVIIARDDYLFAHELALFFLKKGMPVYLDKPGAIYLESAKTLLNTRVNDWQLFTCSPNKYALEFDFKAYSNQIRQKRIPVKIRGVVPNSWEKYIIHVISPLYPCLAALGEPLRFKSIKTTSGIVANYCYENESSLYLEATGKNDVKITISFFINGKEVVHQMEDPFDAFKLSLLAFIDMVGFKKNWFDDVEFLRTVKYIESGIK